MTPAEFLDSLESVILEPEPRRIYFWIFPPWEHGIGSYGD